MLLSLSAACVVLGIGCIGWALVNIAADARVVDSATLYPSDVSGASSVATTPTSTPAQSAVLGKKMRASSEPQRARKIVWAKSPRAGDTLGVLSIPVLGQKLPVIEGTDANDLRKGVGHYAQSVMPGQKDNCVLSGHRDTFFSRLGALKKGDRVTVQTAVGTFAYEVKRIRIVGKNDRTVIVPTDHAVLTLTTCYPFQYVGFAPKRYVVSADMVAAR